MDALDRIRNPRRLGPVVLPEALHGRLHSCDPFLYILIPFFHPTLRYIPPLPVLLYPTTLRLHLSPIFDSLVDRSVDYILIGYTLILVVFITGASWDVV